MNECVVSLSTGKLARCDPKAYCGSSNEWSIHWCGTSAEYRHEDHQHRIPGASDPAGPQLLGGSSKDIPAHGSLSFPPGDPLGRPHTHNVRKVTHGWSAMRTVPRLIHSSHVSHNLYVLSISGWVFHLGLVPYVLMSSVVWSMGYQS